MNKLKKLLFEFVNHGEDTTVWTNEGKKVVKKSKKFLTEYRKAKTLDKRRNFELLGTTFGKEDTKRWEEEKQKTELAEKSVEIRKKDLEEYEGFINKNIIPTLCQVSEEVYREFVSGLKLIKKFNTLEESVYPLVKNSVLNSDDQLIINMVDKKNEALKITDGLKNAEKLIKIDVENIKSISADLSECIAKFEDAEKEVIEERKKEIATYKEYMTDALFEGFKYDVSKSIYDEFIIKVKDEKEKAEAEAKEEAERLAKEEIEAEAKPKKKDNKA